MALHNTGASPATLRDVARLAGVHPGTASRALNAETRSLVNRDTAQRVVDAAEQLGYRPNPIARGLKTNRSYTIGVLIPDLTNPLFPPILRGIEDGLEEAGYTPLIANTDNDPDRERADWETMRARQVEGIIAATAREGHALLDEMIDSPLGLVLVNRRMHGSPVPAATADDRRGQALAVEHLVGLGHERIAYVAGPGQLSTGSDRHAGFLDAMRAAGLAPDPESMIVAQAFTEAHGAEACRELLGRKRAFTAIVAANDLLALGCLDVLAERGIGCPAEISVTGFNDMPFADRFQPPLTTIRIPHYDIGMAAAELMLEWLREPGASARHVQLDPELVVRASTGPARPTGRSLTISEPEV